MRASYSKICEIFIIEISLLSMRKSSKLSSLLPYFISMHLISSLSASDLRSDENEGVTLTLQPIISPSRLIS